MSGSDAQNDGNHATVPAEQLAQANEKIARMAEELDGLAVEQRLMHRLAAAGAVDLEAAVLVAKAKIDGRTDADVDRCVARLRKEKEYLFGGTAQVAVPRKTAVAKDRVTHNQTALEQAARRAARTGSRIDLQRYMQLRRTMM